MNNYLKSICYFFLIWGIEMAVVWLCIDLFIPIEPKQFSNSVGYGSVNALFLVPAKKPVLHQDTLNHH